MYVKCKHPKKVYYDVEQKKTIAGTRSHAVKLTGLVRELIRTGDLKEVDAPTETELKKYAAEDKAAVARKAKVTSKVGNTVEAKFKKAVTDLITEKGKVEALEVELAAANETIVAANLELEELKKVGDPKSGLAKEKAAGTSDKKETAEAKTSEKV